MAIENLSLDIIEVITLNDGSSYYELANTELNTYAEYAAENGMIKEVKILKILIPHSTRVTAVENYYMGNVDMPTWEMTEWVPWPKPQEINDQIMLVLEDNGIYTD
ncbi:MAG: hypothetical protein LBM27_03620 [Lactobacillaceae bacterium]|jgi:hypothetical protein|nr:hypothetical protein [Lactobacillaceae bacterium]